MPTPYRPNLRRLHPLDRFESAMVDDPLPVPRRHWLDRFLPWMVVGLILIPWAVLLWELSR